MRIGIIQSNYIPWRGYFDFIDDVDLFIFHDDLQYTKNDWRNRNRIKTDRGAVWLTVPVRYRSTVQPICETTIDASQRWGHKHINQLRQWYGAAPYFSSYSEELFEILLRPHRTISDLNIVLSRWIMDKLHIRTPTRVSSELQPRGNKTERLIDLLAKVGGTCYVSGPSGRAYLDEGLFKEAGLRLEYKSYGYAPYPQLWGDFIGDVTVLDLLFNTGSDARRYLKSLTPNSCAIG